MSNNIITKTALATALKELMRKKSFRKISVMNITDYCMVSRNTFYYHFSDKYSLLNWIFYTETLREINTFTEPNRWLDGFANLCKHLSANRAFYKDAFANVGYGPFQACIKEFYNELLKVHIDTEYRQKGILLSEEDLVMCARMEAHSYVGIITDWIEDGMNADYMRYYEQLKNINRLNKAAYPKLMPEALNHND